MDDRQGRDRDPPAVNYARRTGRRVIRLDTREEVIHGVWCPPVEHECFFIIDPDVVAAEAAAQVAKAAEVADKGTPAELSPEAVTAIHDYLNRNHNQGTARKLAEHIAQKKLEMRPRRIVEPLISNHLDRKAHRPKSPK